MRMILRTSLVLGCLAFLLLIEDAKPTSCAFYCFVVPSRKEALDISSFRNLSCTHFVYGFSRIRSDMSLRSITSRDNLEINSPGNLRKFLGYVAEMLEEFCRFMSISIQ
ncbi:hypothetical protein TELCIR_13221 [Teladorsagia circumcincta]|uniref:Uncharacterized protein n=1 Tax=Teladorsagia circumcincta TaxID=45464 RepID=A0A2G9U4M5_TELCI|nr:hypothetical protein TELCIR_13221 [Teladorsagia circumcincta]